MSHLYFDEWSLRVGKFFRVTEPVRSKEGDTYEIGEWKGRGSHSVVYQCFDVNSGDERAIKVLLNNKPNIRKRFNREVQLIENIDHPHIATYFGSGKIKAQHGTSDKTRQLPFLVMEMAECNLQQLVWDSDNQIPYEAFIGQFRGLCEALAKLHETAIHRDIKPENILISGEKWLLSDYGLCSFVAPQEEDLTPERGNVGPKFWFSPEAHNKRLGCGGRDINEASDVYQLAAIGWYIVNGRHPSGILTDDDWKGPPNIRDVFMKALFHDCAKRQQDGQVFFEELENAILA